MTVYRDAEIRKGGNPIRVNVEVDVSIRMDTESVEWQGTLHPPNNIGLVLGETYTIRAGLRETLAVNGRSKPICRWGFVNKQMSH